MVWPWRVGCRGDRCGVDVMITLGILLSFIGLTVRILGARRINDKNYWRILPKNDFVQSGIFRYIRHPMYAGSIIMFSGLCMIFADNLFLALFSMLLLINFLMDRADREEQLMIMNHGERYIIYMNNTKMFIPFLI